MQKDPFLNYLKIFSWFLLSFGAVGFVVVALNLAPNIGSRSDALGLLGLQIATGSINLYGFRLYQAQRVSRKALLLGGWVLILGLLIIGQIWINNSTINL